MLTAWFLIIGALLITMALAASMFKRLPLTSAMFYLGVGALLGPWGMNLLRVDIRSDSAAVELLAEVAVLVSLFTAGLKLRLSIADLRWHAPLLLATIAMLISIAGIALFGVVVAGLPLGAAILLGAILAPTDPVLASDVQVTHEHDAEPVRLTLTGEAGLNDGSAFPFVMLGLGLLGHHELGSYGERWLGLDVAWATAGGLLIGAACGASVGKLVLYLRRVHREAVGLDEFLALGTIALSYGLALQLQTYGFLAVFAAGLSLRGIERQHSEENPPPDVEAVARDSEEEATDPATAPAYMARAVLAFNEQLERLGEVAVVVVLGAMLLHLEDYALGLLLAATLFLVIRPLATAITLSRSALSGVQRVFIAWFGVRGIGSVYYLAYALTHGLSGPAAQLVTDATLVVITASIVVHGVSVTPLMSRYSARSGVPVGVGATK